MSMKLFLDPPPVIEEKKCFFCHVKEADTDRKMQICGGCQLALYCGQKCQIKDWKKRHKTVCKLLSEDREAQKTEIIALVNFSKHLEGKSLLTLILKISQQDCLYDQFFEYIKENIDNRNTKVANLCSRASEAVKSMLAHDMIELLTPFYKQESSAPLLHRLHKVIFHYEKIFAKDDEFSFFWLHGTVESWLDSLDFAFSQLHMLDVSIYMLYCPPINSYKEIDKKLDSCFATLPIRSSVYAISSLFNDKKARGILNRESFLRVLKTDYLFDLHGSLLRINRIISDPKKDEARLRNVVALANRMVLEFCPGSGFYDQKLKENLTYVISSLQYLANPAKKLYKGSHEGLAPRGLRKPALENDSGRVLLELKDLIFSNVSFVLKNCSKRQDSALVVKKMYEQLLNIAQFRVVGKTIYVFKPIYYINVFIRSFLLTSFMRSSIERQRDVELLSEISILEIVYSYFHYFVQKEVDERFAEVDSALRKEYLFYIMHLLKERLGSIPGGDYYDRFMQMGIMPREVEGHMNEELNALVDELIAQIECPQNLVKSLINNFNHDQQRSVASLIQQHFDLLMHYGIINKK